ncbi:hypothetical protein BMS3Bbin02_01377 [bacterium BMS3Bbin02]|nr:hypothetical protein BMS3Bbin02_01377 [bacterium BMS3Bbin02]
MDRPTRQEQARAILERRARKLASQSIGRRATSTADFEEAFNLEMMDLYAEIPDKETLLGLGRNLVGPHDGLYILDDGDSFRIYLQEKGETYQGFKGADFETARSIVIDLVIQLDGLPFTPPGI